MKKDVLGAFALLTGGLLALPGESAVFAAPLVAVAAYVGTRTESSSGDVTAKLGSLAARGR